MTGTPTLLPDYYRSVCPDNVKMNIMDCRKECKCVVPKRVYFVEKKYVKKLIADRINDGKRIIYFANSTQTVDEFCSKSAIPKDKCVASFSKEEKRKYLKENNPDAFNDMVTVEKSIREKFVIPEQSTLY